MGWLDGCWPIAKANGHRFKCNFNVFTQKLFLKFCAPTFENLLPSFLYFASNSIKKNSSDAQLFIVLPTPTLYCPPLVAIPRSNRQPTRCATTTTLPPTQHRKPSPNPTTTKIQKYVPRYKTLNLILSI